MVYDVRGHRRRRSLPRFLLALVIVLLAATGAWFYSQRATQSLPSAVTKNVNFALYYPAPLPAGYSLRQGSAKLDKGIVFFSLDSGANQISITEQVLPSPAPDLKAIQTFNTSFKPVSSPAGNAILGIDIASKAPVAILLTNTTLVNINGSKNVPSDVMAKITQSMASLPQ